MPDSYTEFLNLTKPEVGGSPNTWGSKFNDNLDKLDAGVKAANDLAAAAFPKAGNVNITGDYNMSKANPQFGLINTFAGKPADKTRWGFLHFEDGSLYFQNTGADGVAKPNPMQLKPDGNLILAGAYDVKAQIAAAAAAGTAALNAAVKKTGDTMTGELRLSRDQPTLNFTSPGQRAVFQWLTNDGYFRWRVEGANDDMFRVGPGGDMWCASLGDINTRIESRAGAYAENARASASSEANYRYHAARWVYAGDINNGWNINNGYQEPYAGAAVTGRYSYADPVANGAWSWFGGRWRYLQLYANTQGWVTCYYA